MGKLRTEFTSPIVKSTSIGLSDTTFFARCQIASQWLYMMSWTSVVSLGIFSHGGLIINMVACEQALLGALAAGREKEWELATISLEFEFLHWKGQCEMLIGRDNFSKDNYHYPWQVFFNVFSHSFPLHTEGWKSDNSVNGSHRGRDVVACSPSFSCPAARTPRRACSQATNVMTKMEVKSVGTFPVMLLKLVTPPLPPQTKLNLEQNGWKWVLFLTTTLLGEVGGRRYKPRVEQKIVHQDQGPM